MSDRNEADCTQFLPNAQSTTKSSGFHVNVSCICLFPSSQPKSASETSWRRLLCMDTGICSFWVGRECRGTAMHMRKRTQRHNGGECRHTSLAGFVLGNTQERFQGGLRPHCRGPWMSGYGVWTECSGHCELT